MQSESSNNNRTDYLVAVAAGTLFWLLYVALVPFETLSRACQTGACETVFGWRSVFPDNVVSLVFVPFVVPVVLAAWFGRRNRARPWQIACLLVVGPLALFAWTAPHADNDGLWVFNVLFLGFAAAAYTVVALIAKPARRIPEQTAA